MAKKSKSRDKLEVACKIYEPPKPKMDSKKYEAIKTLQSDPYFKDKLWGVHDLLTGYEAGLKANKKGK